MAEENKSKVQTPWKSPNHGNLGKTKVKVYRMPSNVRPPGTRVTITPATTKPTTEKK